ncbi:nucleoside deaminase [Hirschia baltica]|uniref:tRNA-specific adenosine deaminase n=1 Tax=Hirschia baltica (strain ATCC 49814 / DSM 5838 / IFAM 1418) TaxID=582402 RepID=C6XQT0_HIRBI|nr:nucleoside deaminase [Hirschia baltica]ACT58686.1 CMP/dCMP deaminase zinc-binding [Hirschia baltica ATCC 49814]
MKEAEQMPYMARAMQLAEEAALAGEVPVGAVIVDPSTGNIVGEGRNGPIGAHDPTAHAEIVAIRNACASVDNYRLPDLELYVTLEPCAMCAGAISFARIGKVVFAADDPKGGAIKHGPKFFEQSTCHWRSQWEQDIRFASEAGEMLRAFFKSRR